MTSLVEIVAPALEGSIRDYDLKVVSAKTGPLWSSCEIGGKGVSLQFYVEEPDHISDCMVVVDGEDTFDCGSVAELVLGANEIADAVKRKRSLYQNFSAADLFAKTHAHCDFITIYLWPLFVGQRPGTPPYLLKPTPECGNAKEAMVACWIKTYDKPA